MVLVDSSVWIDYIGGVENNHTVWLESAFISRRICLVDLILCEVLQGIRRDAVFEGVRSDFKRFELFSCGGEHLATNAARNFRFLRSKGITVRKTIDCIIATFCIVEGHSLLHRDRDFDPFEEFLGLHVIHPQSN